ncbi:TlpA family protein disulfide reductase [Pseudozobellia thermophila]|uniref:AhpC/TSA family protein n=1 Tax=Pseudozobellia thermophila TaxID=192903 RepID=A0A1M6I1M0_9FLAO|nr:TlpA disulfide reductase family protein [Pseudozobellia thermophila]SHJ28318.1 AhpC/TSA family protein [Pseudozobellia thermophila]
MKRKTVYTLVLIAFVLSFFVTPVGYWSKVALTRMFAPAPEVVDSADRQQITDYDWRLKDANWNYFNFDRSRGKVVLVHFWASWHLPSSAELKDIQELYDEYGQEVDFYIVTNEERAPVEEFLEKNKYSMPITYRIVGAPSPLEIPDPSGTYIIDKSGHVVVKSLKTKDWYNDKVTALFDSLLRE